MYPKQVTILGTTLTAQSRPMPDVIRTILRDNRLMGKRAPNSSVSIKKRLHPKGQGHYYIIKAPLLLDRYIRIRLHNSIRKFSTLPKFWHSHYMGKTTNKHGRHIRIEIYFK